MWKFSAKVSLLAALVILIVWAVTAALSSFAAPATDPTPAPKPPHLISPPAVIHYSS